MVLCSLSVTAVDASMYSHRRFCAALVKVFVQFLVTPSTTCMITGMVCSVLVD